MKRYLGISLFFGMLACAAYPAGADTITDTVAAAKANSKQAYSGYTVPDSVLKGTAQSSAARATANVVNSPEFQDQVSKEQERLKSEVFKDVAGINQPYYSESGTSDRTPHLATDERIYLFVSSSMPAATVRAYVQDIAKLRDPRITVVLRGFVGGIQTFQPTRQFIMSFLKKDPRCEEFDCPTLEVAFEVDPNLYRRFRPEKVPAVVYVRGVRPMDPDVSEGIEGNVPTSNDSKWWMIYGDSSLSYLLGRISQDSGSSSLASISKILGN